MAKLSSNKKILIFLTIFFGLFIIVGIFALFLLTNTSEFSSSTVSNQNGIQVISLKAGLGYLPNKISAKASVPTRLEVQTNKTYDCTAYLNIPKLDVQKFLPPTGTTVIDIPNQNPGDIIEGFCGSNTYKFIIKFS